MAETPAEIESSLGGVPDISEEDLDLLQAQADEMIDDDKKNLDDDGLDSLDDFIEDDPNNPNPDKPKDEPDDKDKDKPKKETPDYKPGESLKKFAEANKLNFNEDQLPENFTTAQEMDLLNQWSQRLVTNTRKNVEDANTLANLYKEDQEVLDFLEARKQGKTMKDYVSELAETPAYTDADSLVSKYLQEENGFTAEEATDEITTLKERGKFENKSGVVQKFYEKVQERETVAQEQQRVADEQAALVVKQQTDQQYANHLIKTEKLGEMIISKEMKEDLFVYATQEDQNQLTHLEQDLQSDENVLKASIAIKYWDKIVSTLKNVSTSTATQNLLDKISVDDPSKLQRSSQGNKSNDFDVDALNSFA